MIDKQKVQHPASPLELQQRDKNISDTLMKWCNNHNDECK